MVYGVRHSWLAFEHHICAHIIFKNKFSKLNDVQYLARTYFLKCNSACLERRWCSAAGDRQFINYISALSLKWYIKDIDLMGFGSGALFPLFRSALAHSYNNFLGAVCGAEHKLYNWMSKAFITGPKCRLWNKSVLQADSLSEYHEKMSMIGQPLDPKLFSFGSCQLVNWEVYPLQNLQAIQEQVQFRCLKYTSISCSGKHYSYFLIHI